MTDPLDYETLSSRLQTAGLSLRSCRRPIPLFINVDYSPLYNIFTRLCNCILAICLRQLESEACLRLGELPPTVTDAMPMARVV